MVISKKYMDYEVIKTPVTTESPVKVYLRGKTAAPYCVIKGGKVPVVEIVKQVMQQAKEYNLIDTPEEERELEQELGSVIFMGK